MRRYAKGEFPNNFIGQREYTVHNIYLDVLTSTGIFGALVLLVFVIKYLIFVFKYLFKSENKKHYFDVLFSVVIVGMIAASALSLSEIFFVNTISVLFFWLLLGKSVYFIRKDEGKD